MDDRHNFLYKQHEDDYVMRAANDLPGPSVTPVARLEAALQSIDFLTHGIDWIRNQIKGQFSRTVRSGVSRGSHGGAPSALNRDLAASQDDVCGSIMPSTSKWLNQLRKTKHGSQEAALDASDLDMLEHIQVDLHSFRSIDTDLHRFLEFVSLWSAIVEHFGEVFSEADKQIARELSILMSAKYARRLQEYVEQERTKSKSQAGLHLPNLDIGILNDYSVLPKDTLRSILPCVISLLEWTNEANDTKRIPLQTLVERLTSSLEAQDWETLNIACQQVPREPEDVATYLRYGLTNDVLQAQALRHCALRLFAFVSENWPDESQSICSYLAAHVKKEVLSTELSALQQALVTAVPVSNLVSQQQLLDNETYDTAIVPLVRRYAPAGEFADLIVSDPRFVTAHTKLFAKRDLIGLKLLVGAWLPLFYEGLSRVKPKESAEKICATAEIVIAILDACPEFTIKSCELLLSAAATVEPHHGTICAGHAFNLVSDMRYAVRGGDLNAICEHIRRNYDQTNRSFSSIPLSDFCGGLIGGMQPSFSERTHCWYLDEGLVVTAGSIPFFNINGQIARYGIPSTFAKDTKLLSDYLLFRREAGPEWPTISTEINEDVKSLLHKVFQDFFLHTATKGLGHEASLPREIDKLKITNGWSSAHKVQVVRRALVMAFKIGSIQEVNITYEAVLRKLGYVEFWDGNLKRDKRPPEFDSFKQYPRDYGLTITGLKSLNDAELFPDERALLLKAKDWAREFGLTKKSK